MLFPHVVPVSRTSPQVQAFAKLLFVQHDLIDFWDNRNSCNDSFFHEQSNKLWFRPTGKLYDLPTLDQSLRELRDLNVDACDCFIKASPFEAVHLQAIEVDAWSRTRWRRRASSDPSPTPGATRLRVHVEPSRPLAPQLSCAIGLAMTA